MKREGRQHGVARTNPNTRSARRFDHTDPSTDLEIRACCQSPAARPTNGSRFTGKCRKARCKTCHYHPVSKSKDKSKGSYKLKSCDVALNHRLVSWRVVGDDSGILNYRGNSASSVLQYLSGNNSSWYQESDDGDNYNYGVEDGFGEDGTDKVPEPEQEPESELQNKVGYNYEIDENVGKLGLESELQNKVGYNYEIDENVGKLESESELELENKVGCNYEIEGEEGNLESESESESESEDEMGFCMVGIAVEFSDGEDWLVVEEI